MTSDDRPAADELVLAALRALDAEDRALEASLADPDVVTDHRRARDIAVKRSALAPVVGGFRTYRSLIAEADALRAAITNPDDPEFAALARDELPGILARAQQTLDHVVASLVHTDDRKVGSVIVEFRAGTGGDEAALWCADLIAMYQKYAARKGWAFEVLDLTPEASAGGVRAAAVSVKGEGVWSELAFEAGVHSVKRVPATEAMGRIHTSTATVAVLPEPQDVDVKIDWERDVVEASTRAQGPGGQNVNKVETAIQLHHKPSGIIIKMQEAKSQSQNREKARRLLIARLYDIQRRQQHEARAAARRAQIGGGDRSEKIRTYRAKDGIVADERLPGEYPFRDIIAGNLDQLLADLLALETQRRIQELGSERASA